jgi:hypothetical protein
VNRASVSLIAVGLLSATHAAADEYDRVLQIRLLTPITSYGERGAAFTASVIGPVVRDGSTVLPSGAIIHGTVLNAKAVGLGLRRERAGLDIRFEACQLPDGDRIPCEAELQTIDNAREQVLSNNRVRGVLAASHANSWLNGVWFRPAQGFVHRSAAGLTGASGIINSRYAPGPAGAAVVITSRLLLFRLPEPEIELPAGTEMIVRVRGDGPEIYKEQQQAPLELPDELVHWLSIQPPVITQTDGKPVADLINVVLAGSRAQLEGAFAAAGWTQADALTPRTFARTYRAYASMGAYPSSPVSPLYYLGSLPDLVFQKTFNSVSKRHHIRLWAIDFGGMPVWLGAATHDTGIAFEWNRMTFTHRIDPMIDIERSKVMNDLAYTGCAVPIQRLKRPLLANREATGGRAVTDGAAAAVVLKDCHARQVAPPTPKPRRSALKLIARRVILETRHYWTRSNAYYWTQRAARWTYSSLKPGR